MEIGDTTREDWLLNIGGEVDSVFREAGYVEIPPYKVSFGCNHNGVRHKKYEVAGFVYSEGLANDDVSQIYIAIQNQANSIDVIDTLIHEICHVIANRMNYEKKNKQRQGHGKIFQKLCKAVGLEIIRNEKGRIISTIAGPVLLEKIKKWIKIHGECPHSIIDLTKLKKQGVRMIKCECPSCEYILRTSMTNIKKGIPLCPVQSCPNYCKKMIVPD